MNLKHWKWKNHGQGYGFSLTIFFDEDVANKINTWFSTLNLAPNYIFYSGPFIDEAIYSAFFSNLYYADCVKMAKGQLDGPPRWYWLNFIQLYKISIQFCRGYPSEIDFSETEYDEKDMQVLSRILLENHKIKSWVIQDEECENILNEGEGRESLLKYLSI